MIEINNKCIHFEEEVKKYSEELKLFKNENENKVIN
jgi:hypothetical protein